MTKKKSLLNTISVISYIINSVIGYTIWIIPKYLFLYSSNLFTVYFALIVCSVIAMILAFCYGELGAIFDRGYGEPTYYEFFYGTTASQIYSLFSIVFILPICMLTCLNFSVEFILKKSFILKFLLLIFFYSLNAFKLNWSLRMQTYLTYLKVSLTCVVPLFALLLKLNIITSKVSTSENIFNVGSVTLQKAFEKSFSDSFFVKVKQFILLIPLIINAYDGMNSANYITNKVHNPSRTFKIAIPVAILFISLFYFVVVTSFFYIVPAAQILSLDPNNNIRTILTLFSEQFEFFANSKIIMKVILTTGNLVSLNGQMIALIFISESLFNKKSKLISGVICVFISIISYFDIDFLNILAATTCSIYFFYFFTMIILTHLCYSKKPVESLDFDLQQSLEISEINSQKIAQMNFLVPLFACFLSVLLILSSVYILIF